MLNRRQFLQTVAVAATIPSIPGRAAAQSSAGEWGSPVFDLHFHLRPEPGATSRTSTAPA